MQIKVVFAFVLAGLLSLAAFAQQQPSEPKKEQELSWAMRPRIFEIKNREPREIYNAIAGLSSRSVGGTMTYSTETKTIAVRDFPENLLVIADAIRRLDVPPTPQSVRPPIPDVEVTAYILVASMTEASPSSYPPVLKEVIAQLQATLNYKSYTLLTPMVQRTKLEGGSFSSVGNVTLPDSSFGASYMFATGGVNSVRSDATPLSISFENLQLTLDGRTGEDGKQLGKVTILTKVTMRDGEKIVVGTSNLKDKGIVLVLTAKVIK